MTASPESNCREYELTYIQQQTDFDGFVGASTKLEDAVNVDDGPGNAQQLVEAERLV